jgi:hypothetical protein
MPLLVASWLTTPSEAPYGDRMDTLPEIAMAAAPSDALERLRLFERAVARWENEGGAVEGRRLNPPSTETSPETSLVMRAELVQTQIRVIA